jgi:hypothetical protein
LWHTFHGVVLLQRPSINQSINQSTHAQALSKGTSHPHTPTTQITHIRQQHNPVSAGRGPGRAEKGLGVRLLLLDRDQRMSRRGRTRQGGRGRASDTLQARPRPFQSREIFWGGEGERGRRHTTQADRGDLIWRRAGRSQLQEEGNEMA